MSESISPMLLGVIHLGTDMLIEGNSLPKFTYWTGKLGKLPYTDKRQRIAIGYRSPVSAAGPSCSPL
jgi:hypothetical protein